MCRDESERKGQWATLRGTHPTLSSLPLFLLLLGMYVRAAAVDDEDEDEEEGKALVMHWVVAADSRRRRAAGFMDKTTKRGERRALLSPFLCLVWGGGCVGGWVAWAGGVNACVVGEGGRSAVAVAA